MLLDLLRLNHAVKEALSSKLSGKLCFTKQSTPLTKLPPREGKKPKRGKNLSLNVGGNMITRVGGKLHLISIPDLGGQKPLPQNDLSITLVYSANLWK